RRAGVGASDGPRPAAPSLPSGRLDYRGLRSGELGFRGEALASIVEVSKTEIISKSDESPEGVRVELEGGRVLAVRAAGRAPGTTVDVRELFFNVPARRKFLKSAKTEFFHIVRAVKRFALAYPTVHFRLEHDGKTVLDLPPSSDLRQTLARLYTADFARALLDVSMTIPGLTVRGLVSPSHLTRSDRTEQFLFVNGRFVKDSQINYAISQAYESALKSEQYPYIFLFIEIDPRAVDVNVHPQKSEVRFAEPIKVQALVKQAITRVLTSAHAVPRLEKTPPLAPPRHGEGRGAGKELEAHPHIHPLSPLRERGEGVRGDGEAPLLATGRGRGQLDAATACSPVRVLGQLHGTYIVVQTESGLEIIDQHVAHERILYERFLAQLKENKIVRQRLLIPVTVEMSPDKAELLAGHLQELGERLGIGIEHFGGRTFILRDWPQVLTSEWSRSDFTETLERVLAVLERESEPALEELAKALAARVACEAAVVKNKPLRPEEMTELIRQLKQTQNPYHCPHGRPIVLAYSLEELEKKFGRR
ncbi:MAG: DNA mismatch repair endonuclease MutL, partial [Candidatus Bipolaricaulota bacterium]|nr:DNA mismatch repair endonuclease MutL [Candidatus Bipolaricaulota bacterium]